MSSSVEARESWLWTIVVGAERDAEEDEEVEVESAGRDAAGVDPLGGDGRVGAEHGEEDVDVS